MIEEVKLIDELYELVTATINELCGQLSIRTDIIIKFINLSERIEALVRPVDDDFKPYSVWNTSPLHAVYNFFEPSSLIQLKGLPSTSQKILSNLSAVRSSLFEMQNEPWDLIENGLPRSLEQNPFKLTPLEL